MRQKSSDPQAISFVSQPLKRDNERAERHFHKAAALDQPNRTDRRLRLGNGAAKDRKHRRYREERRKQLQFPSKPRHLFPPLIKDFQIGLRSSFSSRLLIGQCGLYCPGHSTSPARSIACEAVMLMSWASIRC